MPLRSEADFYRLLDRYFPNQDPGVSLMRGDDAAVIRTPGRLAVSCDLFVEDVHFRRAYFRPEEIGYKALAVNLSDMAGMGARPTGFVLGLAADLNAPETFFQGLLAGMAGLAQSARTPLVGGDVSATNPGGGLNLCITVWGAPPEGGRFLYRGKTLPGDVLFVLGRLGWARAGLALLEAEGGDGPGLRSHPELIQAHLRPAMLLDEAQTLSRLSGVCGLMDVSDGLATDLPRFLAPGQGAEIELEAATLGEPLRRYAREVGADPFELAWRGGEDYALLGACAPDAWDAVRTALPRVRRLGVVRPRPGFSHHGQIIPGQGFDHFGHSEAGKEQP